MSPIQTRIGLAIAIGAWLAYAVWALDGLRLVGAIVVAIGAPIVNEIIIADERRHRK